jgi:hypothetical protein
MNRIEAAVIARAAKAAKQAPLEQRFWSKVERLGPDECWPWKASVRNKKEGYGAFWLEGRHQPSNRVALVLSGVEVPEGMVACHRCDNPRCCNPAHLFVGTPKQNNDDKVAKRRHAHGERHGCAKLTDEQVAEIRSLRVGRKLPPGIAQQFAERFGITKQYVSELFTSKRGVL